MAIAAVKACANGATENAGTSIVLTLKSKPAITRVSATASIRPSAMPATPAPDGWDRGSGTLLARTRFRR